MVLISNEGFATNFCRIRRLRITHHSKTLKDGWAKYIPNFALK
jgi:hypothetical protein